MSQQKKRLDHVVVAGGTPLQYADVEPLVVEAKNRPKVPRATRIEIYARDHYRCVKCGFGGRDQMDHLTVDHIVPFSKGGSTTKRNLQTMCVPCNEEKRDRLEGKVVRRGK